MKILVLVIQNTEFDYSVVVGSAFYSAVFFLGGNDTILYNILNTYIIISYV